ncbi:DUF4265 domain-containing protein [Corynebacterium marinum]|uniref:DUF4265 domain-containing protein n=1 Tax=Corynebacterium marinum DSM 44953 TaxID=1224162 RepID=A0A0B6TYR5_9CORY|nr:DUF4265 domain-containing protein [Corynebacterium marinum]AJK69826.1 Hypothetical protein B840_11270 [Corynebacterium marinum DSM 44953]GGO18965.1 hypothetical protein GCM10010980_17680 [Corynebacterium marinum]
MVTLIAPVALPGVDSEELAADPLGGGHFVLCSIPVVAEGLALGDIVSCVTLDGRPNVDRVVVAGGNTTVRVLVDAPFAAALRQRLEDLGCRVEQPLPGLLVLSVGPDAPGEGIRAHLADLADQGVVQIAAE